MTAKWYNYSIEIQTPYDAITSRGEIALWRGNAMSIPTTKPKRKPAGYWTKNRLMETAAKYNSRSSFQKGDGSAYVIARTRGILDEICSHMIQLAVPVSFWTYEMCATSAAKYKTRNKFQREARKQYRAAKINGWLDEICAHMEIVCGKWTKEKCAEKATLYSSRGDFIKGDRSAYLPAHRNGWLDEICAHMDWVTRPNNYWTKERCLIVARGYASRAKFKDGAGSAYDACLRNGWAEEACSHMRRLSKPDGHWTKDKCLERALMFETRSEFSNATGTAYDTCRANGWLEEACAHMRPVGNLLNRCVYIIIANDFEDKRIYVGITYDIKARVHRRSHVVSLKEMGKLIQITDYIPAEDAAKIEIGLIASFRHDQRWICVNKSDGGELGFSHRETLRRVQNV